MKQPIANRKSIAVKDIPAFRVSLEVSIDLASPEAIKREFERLCEMFDNHRGWACYELGNVMTKLASAHEGLTGEYLRKSKIRGKE